MPAYRYLIVGGSMTADAAVRGIRELDGTSPIGVLSAEADPPYARPPLSKALWKGEPFESVWRNTNEVGVDLKLNCRVANLDLAAKTAIDDRGIGYRFDRLLLATGGTPRRFPFGGEEIIYFRTLDDYRRLRALADGKPNVAVIGGGFIGSEIAAALAMHGCRVTLLFPEAGIGARLFPADLARFLVDFYREKGVDVRPGEQVAGVARNGSPTEIELQSGGRVTADAIVAGIGITPITQLAQATGLAVGDGIEVDAELRTTHLDVFAAGDVARFNAPALGERIRVEHEDNALTMGRAAGRAMAGDPTPYEHLPFFYSDLFELGYEAVGELDPRGEVVADWKEPFREGVIYYIRKGRVRGVLLWNTWGQVDAARQLIRNAGPFRSTDLIGRLPVG
ncbi:MAG: NAD(P)/FAD-dependent oxidoreductase [Gemmatimonadales bacterium]